MLRYLKYASGIFLLQAACMWWGFLVWSVTKVPALDAVNVASTMTLFFVALGFVGFSLSSLLGASYLTSKIPVPAKNNVIQLRRPDANKK